VTSSYLEKPKYLTPLKGGADDFTVVASRVYLQEVSSQICGVLDHPVTIIDINRLQQYKNNPQQCRVDSKLELFALRTSCKLLRHCAGHQKCLECDSFHAELFEKLPREAAISVLEARIDKKANSPLPFFVSSYKSQNMKPHILKDKNYDRPVIEYFCPLLGYRELLFPIYYNDEVIGVLFVGQSLVREEHDENKIQETMAQFFSKNESYGLFKKYLEKNYSPANNGYALLKKMLVKNYDFNEQTKFAADIVNIIRNSDKDTEAINLLRLMPHSQPYSEAGSNGVARMTFESLSDYKMFIQTACKELQRIENDLVDKANEKFERFFQGKVQSAVEAFFESTRRNQNLVSEQRENIVRMWSAFCKFLQTIDSSFSLEQTLIFGDGSQLSAAQDKKKYLYPKNEKSKSIYDFEKVASLIKKTTYDPVTSLDTPKLFDGLQAEEADCENSVLIVFADMALLLHVQHLEKHRKIYEVMVKALADGVSHIYSAIELTTSNYVKMHHELSLRMFRHESAHIADRLSDRTVEYFSSPDAFRQLGESKRDDVYHDLTSSFRLIANMAKNIGIILGRETAKISTQKVSIFKDLLYKWEKMFAARLEGRNLAIRVPNIDPFDEKRPYKIKIDPELFELLIYNLVDNAVKYAGRGSMIYLDCKRPHDQSYFYSLTVTNYGPAIELGEKPYELYYRGKQLEASNTIDGDGIGLYVVKAIASLLDLPIEPHLCFLISDYNLPLVQWYLEEDFDEAKYPDSQAKKIELEQHIERMHGEIDPRGVINRTNTCITRPDLSQKYLTERINRKTYCVQFKVQIPISMETS